MIELENSVIVEYGPKAEKAVKLQVGEKSKSLARVCTQPGLLRGGRAQGELGRPIKLDIPLYPEATKTVLCMDRGG